VAILFALSIIAAIVRTTIRTRSQGRFLLDDYLLLFGYVTLTAGTTLLYIILDDVYWYMGLILNPNSPSTFQAFAAPDFFDLVKSFQQLTFAFVALTWTTIFAVKLSFLLFFRQMVNRLRNVIIYWWIVVGVTLVSYCYCVAGIFIACPHFGLEACKWNQ
jgi:hypothetical protein